MELDPMLLNMVKFIKKNKKMIYIIISILICIYWFSMMIAGLIVTENMSEWKSYKAFCMMMVPIVNTCFVVNYLINNGK